MNGHDGCINWRLRLKWWFSSFVVAVIALYSQLQAALLATDPTQKCVLTQTLHQAAMAGELQWDTDAPCLDFARAGQPAQPVHRAEGQARGAVRHHGVFVPGL